MQGITRLVALAPGFNLFNNDMPPGIHPDEPKKVIFVLRGSRDFKHPVLMLQVNRLCTPGWEQKSQRSGNPLEGQSYVHGDAVGLGIRCYEYPSAEIIDDPPADGETDAAPLRRR